MSMIPPRCTCEDKIPPLTPCPTHGTMGLKRKPLITEETGEKLKCSDGLWKQMAYAELGMKRGAMTKKEVEIVQEFLGPLEP